MSETMTRQERETARYQAEFRACKMCGSSYGGGTYADHRDGEDHQRYLRSRRWLSELEELPLDEVLAPELCSEILGQPSGSLSVRQVMAQL